MKHNRKLLEDQELDQFFKSNLEHHEVTPDETNWSKIRQWRVTPFLYPILNNSLLKFAASFLLFIATATLCYLISTTDSSNEIAVIEPSESIPEIVAQIPTAPIQEPLGNKTDFVMDISEEENEVDPIREELIEKEIDEYLAFLFEDEDEFAGAIDSLEIYNSLLPANQLPIDEMFSHIPDLPRQEVITILAPLKTKITLPHRFVEQGEAVEDYLALYELNSRQQ